MIPFTIRPAVPDDAAAIAQVHFQAWQETYTGLINQHYLDHLSPDRKRQRLEENGCRQFLVVQADDKVVGFSSYCHSRDEDAGASTGEIQAIYLLRAYQHQGIGRALMAATLQCLHQLGMTKVTLWALAANAQAIGFYQHCGFTADGHSKDVVIGTTVTELRYQRSL